MTEMISIVIPNLHSRLIDKTIASLRQQNFDLSRVEILVVGLDGPGLVKEDNLVRMVSTNTPASPAVARNIGIQEAIGDIICFIDADCIADADWLARLNAVLLDKTIDIVGGGVTFTSDNYWTLCDNLGWFHEYLVSARPGVRDLLPTLNLCVRRRVVHVVGGLNETYPNAAGEDAEWTTRMRQAGFTLHFAPQAVVHHHPARASFLDIWRHAYTYGRYSVKVNHKLAGFLRTPFFFHHSWVLLLFAPLVIFAGTMRIFIRNPQNLRYAYAFPGILLGKLAWILGAARTLRCTAEV
jgi:glycosyltransferase involved in cell wall biosynthesis